MNNFEDYMKEVFVGHKFPDHAPDLTLEQKIIELKRCRLELTENEQKWTSWIVEKLYHRKSQLEENLANILIERMEK